MAESMQTQRRVIDCRDQSDDGLRLRCGDTPETNGEWNRIACWDHPAFENGIADFARKLERERNSLRDAIRLAVAKHARIAWGYDGDAGSNDIMSELEDSLENDRTMAPPTKP
jgi:hypothetical protein